MDTQEHKQAFQEIIKKYGLSQEEKASQIADYLMQKKEIDAHRFAQHFGMQEKDAVLFLSFIHKGIRFKEEHIDR